MSNFKNGTRWDWEAIQGEVTKNVLQFESVSHAARVLGIPPRTVSDAVGAGKLELDIVPPQKIEEFVPEPVSDSANEFVINMPMNHRPTLADILEAWKIDLSVWEVERFEVRQWQMGRKDTVKDLDIIEGRITGTTTDSGGINKVWLYHVHVKLTRIERIPVVPVLQPITITLGQDVCEPAIYSGPMDEETILVWGDTQVGFDGNEPFHHRPFMSALLELARFYRPNTSVMLGDGLDIPDGSTFLSEPSILGSIQTAAVELGWYLGKMRQTCEQQFYLEGNHEIRFRKAQIKHLPWAYELRPIHDLDGSPLLSIPRFMGLSDIDTIWVGDYPDGYVQVGEVIFEHGRTARQKSGQTTVFEGTEATISRFWGHIHRFELVKKIVKDRGTEVWLGSPGCMCRKGIVPGSSVRSNWHIGAFLITMRNGRIKNVDPITWDEEDQVAYFRGGVVSAPNYMDEYAAYTSPKHIRI